jgi:PGF-pre-PGF domain-containing protein
MALNSKVWAWAFLFLLVISSAVAVEDFTATGTGRILGTACSPAEGEITVFNTGTQQSVFELIAEGPASEWALFVPESFVLNPGQSQKVQEFFALPCDAEDAYLDVAIATEELELVLSQDVVVQTANNLALTPVVYSQTVLPCDPADFSFTLSNPADFVETYRLKVFDAPETTTLSDTKLTIPPGQNETVSITVSPKDCTLAGDFVPVLQVKTEKSKVQAEIEMFLRINDSDIPEIAKGIQTIRAGFAAQEASFDIFNTGDRATTYYLRTEGADWVSVLPETVTIQARDREALKLVLQPTESTPQGTYDVTLAAEVEATGKEYEKTFTIKLKEPSFTDHLFTAYLPFTIAGIIVLIILAILAVWGHKKYNSPEMQAKRAEARAERERRRQEKLAMKEEKRRQREEEKARKLEEKARTAEEKKAREEREAKEAERHERELERERVRAQKAYDKQLRREHLVVPKEEIIKGIKLPGKKLLKLALLLLVLIIIGFGLSFRQAIANNLQEALTGLAVLIVIFILHRIRRSKIVRKRWKLALANKIHVFDTKWRKGLTQVSFKLNTVVERLMIVTRRRKASIAPPAEEVYQTFAITPNTESDIVGEARLKFRVKRSWMLRNRVAPSTVRLFRLADDRWQSIIAEPVSTDDKYVYYVADVDGFGEFAIAGKAGKQRASRRAGINARGIAIAAFCIIAIIALVSLGIILPDKTPTVGIPAQVWKQDTQHTLDLGAYFKDPDGDTLAFSSTRAENIEILFVEDKALLTPHYGWSGTERVVFIADDGKGGIVKSNPTELIVEPTLIPKTWKRNAKPIFTIAIIALIVLGTILFRKRIKKIVGLSD